jgi:CRP-like cAMP-binding protein
MTDVNLDHIDRFSDLSDDEVKKIAKTGTYVTVPENWALMGEGTAADKAYLLISGEVSVRHGGEEVATLGPGEIFGEMGIVNHKLRTATVISKTRLECLHFTRDQIEKLENEIPSFKKALTDTSSSRSQKGSDEG